MANLLNELMDRRDAECAAKNTIELKTEVKDVGNGLLADYCPVQNRLYVPFGGGYELQTKGGGSTFRLSDGKDQIAIDHPYAETFFMAMAKSLHAERQATIAAANEMAALLGYVQGKMPEIAEDIKARLSEYSNLIKKAPQ